MTLLGGMGTVFGPVVGALLVTAMENYLAQFGAWVTVTQGAIFVVCVLAFRRGIIGEIIHLMRPRSRTEAKMEAAGPHPEPQHAARQGV